MFELLTLIVFVWLLVKAAGLNVPFEEAALQEVAAAAEQWLGQNKPQ